MSAGHDHSPTGPSVVGLVGVYHANGGVLGEMRYLVGSLLGTTHCALCQITHSAVRRKPAWDAMVGRLGLPFSLVHLNEMPPDVAAVVAEVGSPLVLVRVNDGSVRPLLGPAELEALDGSVDGVEKSIRTGLELLST